ncbi:MAG TPA: hypothetical protein VMV31_02745 [Terriglobales bacterium]|nr:hypothetical protein [Terriglobales bacterium]
MSEFLRSQFDKLLLTALLLVFCGVAVHGYCAGGAALAGFASDQAKEFGGALLGLITGHALAATAGRAPGGEAATAGGAPGGKVAASRREPPAPPPGGGAAE